MGRGWEGFPHAATHCYIEATVRPCPIRQQKDWNSVTVPHTHKSDAASAGSHVRYVLAACPTHTQAPAPRRLTPLRRQALPDAVRLPPVVRRRLGRLLRHHAAARALPRSRVPEQRAQPQAARGARGVDAADVALGGGRQALGDAARQRDNVCKRGAIG